MGDLQEYLGIEDIRGKLFAHFDNGEYILYRIDNHRPLNKYGYYKRGEPILVLNVLVDGKPRAWPLDEHLHDIDEEMIKYLNLPIPAQEVL